MAPTEVVEEEPHFFEQKEESHVEEAPTEEDEDAMALKPMANRAVWPEPGVGQGTTCSCRAGMSRPKSQADLSQPECPTMGS